MIRWIAVLLIAGLLVSAGDSTWRAAGAAAETPDAATPPEPEASSSASAERAPVRVEDLKALYESAEWVVYFEVESVEANPTVAPRLVWELKGLLLETLKGTLLPGKISIHTESIVRSFHVPRSDLPGRRFVAPVTRLSPEVERRFRLAGAYAFEAESAEARVLRQLAGAEAERGASGENLHLAVRPLQQVFQVTGPKPIELCLTNEGEDSATYFQAPIAERDGDLYLAGQGAIRIRDLSGRVIPDKGNVITGQVPPPPPTPALILSKASFVETIDLDRFFELPAGRYTLVLMLATPSGIGRIPSGGLSFQVGAVNLPLPPAREGSPGPSAERPAGEAPKEKVDLPEPTAYTPGKVVSGLAGLLQPTQPRYALGEPVIVSLRLINTGARSAVVDTRLERTLTIQVTPLKDSPAPLFIRQVIPWPADTDGPPETRAYLREGAFWGQTVDLNTLAGKSLDDYPAPTPEEIATRKGLNYERFGRNLFGFPKPGVYRIKAIYRAERPRHPQPDAGTGEPSNWWSGELETNSITIQIAGAKGR